MITKPSFVSVIIPAFNSESTIARAIESVVAQQFHGDFEIIVVNDGSTDQTAEVLRSYGDRIKIVTQENRGVSAARNAGVRNSEGEYLAFLDADDEWLPRKLAATATVLDTDPRCGLVYSDATRVSGTGQVIAPSHIPGEYMRPPLMDDLLREWWHILPSTVVMRRSVFEKCGGFSEEFGRGSRNEDIFMWLVVREIASFRLVSDTLVRYQISSHEESQLKRDGQKSCAKTGVDAPRSPWRFIHGELVFNRLVRERYGRRARRLLRNEKIWQASILETMGLASVWRGDTDFARRFYLASIYQMPVRLKVWVRLAWIILPSSLRRFFIAVIPSRLVQPLQGPPINQLSSSPKQSG
jgi:glycosyltransferase involved in cell wall biosynthesis